MNDEWGTVCDQMWDDADAAIVCRELGLATIGSTALSGASFGLGTGRIWLHSVQCTGSEKKLINCTASSSELHSCTHAQDAGVRCLQGTNFYFYISLTSVRPFIKAVLREMSDLQKVAFHLKVV